jgi:hypothetical protein
MDAFDISVFFSVWLRDRSLYSKYVRYAFLGWVGLAVACWIGKGGGVKESESILFGERALGAVRGGVVGLLGGRYWRCIYKTGLFMSYYPKTRTIWLCGGESRRRK